MKFINKNWQRLVLLSYIFVTPFYTLYACTAGTICNPLESSNINSISDYIHTFLTKALELGIPVVALAVIYCGFLFVAARGNSEKLTKAKAALLYTLIGAAILLGAWAIATLLQNTVGAL